MTTPAQHYVQIFANEPPHVIRDAIEAVESVEPAGDEHAAKLRTIIGGLQDLLTKAEGRLL